MKGHDDTGGGEQRTDDGGALWARNLAKVRNEEPTETTEIQLTVEVAADSAAALQSAFDVAAPIEADLSTSGAAIANNAVVSVESNSEGTYESGYDKQGNKIPLPSDTCDACGVRREDRPDGFVPEIMTPFGDVEYLCGRCRDRGRGMK